MKALVCVLCESTVMTTRGNTKVWVSRKKIETERGLPLLTGKFNTCPLLVTVTIVVLTFVYIYTEPIPGFRNGS